MAAFLLIKSMIINN